MVFIALEIELRMELILPRSTLAKFTCRGEGLTTGASTGVVVMGVVFAGSVSLVVDTDTVFVGVAKIWDGLVAVIWELFVAVAFVILDTGGRLDFSFLSSTGGQRTTISVKCYNSSKFPLISAFSYQ